MGTVVQKFGGTSVGDAERIKRVAERVTSTVQDGNHVCVAVSAMGDTTDELVELAARLCRENVETRCLADVAMAKHDPVPAWAVATVISTIVSLVAALYLWATSSEDRRRSCSKGPLGLRRRGGRRRRPHSIGLEIDR